MNETKLPETYTFTVTEAEANTILAGLDELPKKFSAPLEAKLREQATKQIEELNKPVEVKEATAQ